MRTIYTHFSMRPLWHRWGLLLLLSAFFLAILELAHIPAALMLGPMLGGICIGCMRGNIKIQTNMFRSAQTIIGCMIASSVSPKVLDVFLQNWWLFLLVILLAVLVSSALGFLLAKFRVIPPSTAIWGSSPGAAATMVIMAEEFKADITMVAFMQYLRVLMTAFAASLVAAIFIPETLEAGTQSAIELQWFPPIIPSAFLSTIGLATFGAIVTRLFHIPAGYILIPLLAGAILRSLGLIELQLPEWLLAISYALLGWRIGLSFDLSSLRRAYKVLPHLLGTTLCLIGFCAFLSWILVFSFGVDPLTAYLATSPGGLDTIAIICASRPDTDMSFVITFQVARLFLLNLICPPLAKALSRHFKEQ